MLPHLQRAFHDAVLGESDGALPKLVAGSPGDAAARIAIYRNTVQGSLIEVLAAAFPVVQRILGAQAFAALARRFVAAAPPRLPQLSAYGAGFADFLAAAEDHHGLPYLPDAARLEWARGVAYFAADTAVLDPAVLAATASGALNEMTLALHPATALIRSKFPIHRIWQVNQPEVADVPKVDMSVAEDVLISRNGPRVHVRRIGAGDAAFVAALGVGSPLGAACEAAAADPSFDLEIALRDHLIAGTFRA